MVNTIEKHLLSTRFWSLISTLAVTGAISSFYSTQQHSKNFNYSSKYFISSIILFHLIIFFSNPNSLKNKFAPFFLGPDKKWMLRITAMRAGYMLHYVSEPSVLGLVFVISVWIDVIAIGRIVKPSVDLWVVNSVFMAVVSRSCDLYGFSGGYWLVMLFCFLLTYLQVRMEGYKSDEMEKKEELSFCKVSELDDKQLSCLFRVFKFETRK